MYCGHCGIAFHEKEEPPKPLTETRGYLWIIFVQVCPACEGENFVLASQEAYNYIPRRMSNESGKGYNDPVARMVWPRVSPKPPAPPEVPEPLAKDFHQACMVLTDSPEASAALSRRCLQGVLRDKGFDQRDLMPQIQAALASNQLPLRIAQDLDAVRIYGNFAAHPTKSQTSGEIVEVEPGEAEWNLDILEALFDFWYVQEAESARRRAAANAKLADAGRQSLLEP